MSPPNCAISDCCWKGARYPISDATIWRSKSSAMWKVAKRYACAPIFCGRRGAAGEQIGLYYGERWEDWQPWNDVERGDILRAATGYALGEDALGLARLHEKYAAKMAQTPDAQAF